MKLSFVIPVYRNEGSLIPTFTKIKDLVTKNKFEYELIFVNDGSDDNSFEELKELFKIDSNVKVLSFSRNFGQVAAVIAGLKEVTGDVVISMSADLQEPIELIEQMVQKWQEGNEYAIELIERTVLLQTIPRKYFIN